MAALEPDAALAGLASALAITTGQSTLANEEPCHAAMLAGQRWPSQFREEISRYGGGRQVRILSGPDEGRPGEFYSAERVDLSPPGREAAAFQPARPEACHR